jgi:hypothetical protein
VGGWIRGSGGARYLASILDYLVRQSVLKRSLLPAASETAPLWCGQACLWPPSLPVTRPARIAGHCSAGSWTRIVLWASPQMVVHVVQCPESVIMAAVAGQFGLPVDHKVAHVQVLVRREPVAALEEETRRVFVPRTAGKDVAGTGADMSQPERFQVRWGDGRVAPQEIWHPRRSSASGSGYVATNKRPPRTT